MHKFPRERVPKQAKPRPESHQPPPLWPGTSRFDPRGEAGPLGPSGVESVPSQDAMVVRQATGSIDPAQAASRQRDGRPRNPPAGAEWGEAAARRTGGSLIVTKPEPLAEGVELPAISRKR